MPQAPSGRRPEGAPVAADPSRGASPVQRLVAGGYDWVFDRVDPGGGADYPRRLVEQAAGGRTVGAGKGCSVDMYLLAPALGRPIHAEATCPTTGTPIRVDIIPEGVERIDPSTAVVAVVDLDADLTLGPDRTDTEVCAQQPFFASAQAASRWLADHPQGRLIPVRSFHAEARRLIARLEAAPPATPIP
jgi:alkylmercury lyase